MADQVNSFFYGNHEHCQLRLFDNNIIFFIVELIGDGIIFTTFLILSFYSFLVISMLLVLQPSLSNHWDSIFYHLPSSFILSHHFHFSHPFARVISVHLVKLQHFINFIHFVYLFVDFNLIFLAFIIIISFFISSSFYIQLFWIIFTIYSFYFFIGILIFNQNRQLLAFISML